MEIRNQIGLKSQDPLVAEEGEAGSSCNTPPQRCKMKGLSELGEPSTHPRRSVRLSERSSQARNDLLPSEGFPTTSISDGDINNCNARVCIPRTREVLNKML